MRTLFRSTLSCILLLVGYECLVAALRQLNRPSDLAVYLGMASLAVLFLLVPIALWRIWRSSL